MTEVTLSIDGMSCMHCVGRVLKAIDAVDGVKSSVVDIGKAVVNFDESKTSSEAITEAITRAVAAAGYKVK
jgi:copper chaperone CopZ